MKDPLAISQTRKKPSLGGAARPPRRRPSRPRSFPRVGWLLIFELVQNFHNTPRRRRQRRTREGTLKVRRRGRRAARKRKRERETRGERKTESRAAGVEGRNATRGWRRLESPSASDGFELGKVQPAQKRHPPPPCPSDSRHPSVTHPDCAHPLESLACLSLHPPLPPPPCSVRLSPRLLSPSGSPTTTSPLSLYPNAHTFSSASMTAEISVQRQGRERSLLLDDVVPLLALHRGNEGKSVANETGNIGV